MLREGLLKPWKRGVDGGVNIQDIPLVFAQRVLLGGSVGLFVCF